MSTDSLIVIRRHGSICAYSLSDGCFQRQFSRKGRKENEFLFILASWIDKNHLFLLDSELNKILEFDLSSDTDTPSSTIYLNPNNTFLFSSIARLNEDLFVGRRQFGNGSISELSVFDNDFNHVNDIGNRKLNSGITGYNPFAQAEIEGVSYAPYYQNVIEHISADCNITHKYTVSFGKHTLPPRIMRKSAYDVLTYIEEHSSEVASYIDNVYEKEGKLFFSFLYDRTIHYVYVNNKTGVRKIMVFDGGGNVKKIMRKENYTIILTEEDNNPSKLFFISNNSLSQ